MRKLKSKCLKRRRILVAVGRIRNSIGNHIQVQTRDGREVAPLELKGLVPIDRDQNLVIEWWE